LTLCHHHGLKRVRNGLSQWDWDVEENIQWHLYILFLKEDFILILLLILSIIKTTYLIIEIVYNPHFLYHSRYLTFLTVITQSHCITYSHTIKSYSYYHNQVPKHLSFIFPCAFGSSKFPCESFVWIYIFTSVCRVPCLLTKMCPPCVILFCFSSSSSLLLTFIAELKLRKPIIWFVIPVLSYKLCWFYQLSNTTIWW